MKNKLLIQPGTWYAEFDENGNCTDIYYADSFRRLLGYGPGEYAAETGTWMNSIHPEDKARAIRELNACVSRMSAEADYDIEYRMMTKQGYRWFHDYAHCVRRKDGTGTRCDGIIFDIDDAVRQQKSLADHRVLLDYFVDQYWSACFIDLEKDTLEVIRANNANTSTYIMDGTHADMERFIDTHFHPDDKALMRQITDKDFVRKELKDKASISYTAREMIDGEEKTMRILIVRGVDENHVAVGFMDISEEIAEQKKRLLGAVPLSNDVLAKANIGLWSFELDEGKPPRMYADSTMLGLLGLDRQVPPEETYHAWYDHIDSGSYTLVSDAVAKMTAGEHAEVQYPWHHPDGRTMIVRCGGVRNPEYRKGIRIEGTHQDVTQTLHFDEEQQKLREKQIIEPFIAQYGTVCKVRLEDGASEMLKAGDSGIGYRADITDFNGLSTYYIENSVYPSDREMLLREANTERIRERLKSKSRYSVEFRVVTGGVAAWYEMVVSALSGNEAVIGFRMDDIGILNRHISTALLGNYDAIYISNLNTDQMKVLKASGMMMDRPQTVCYSKTLREFASGLDTKAKDYFLKVADIDYEKNILRKDGKAEYAYQSPYYGKENVWVKCEIHVLTWADGEPETAVIGISRVDTLQKEKIELDAQLQEALNSVTEEKDRFAAAAQLINSANWSFRLDENGEVADAEFFGEPGELLGIDLNITPHAWENILHPEDRERTLKAFNAAVHDRSGKTPYDVTYRMHDRNGTYNWFRSAGKIIEHSDGAREFFGIHVNINDRIEEQNERIREAEETAKLIESVAGMYRFAFTADTQSGEIKVIRMDPEVREAVQADSFETYQAAVTPLFRMLHPADRARMERELRFDTIREKLEQTHSYNIEYRINARGATEWHEMNVTRIAPGRVAMGFGEKDLEIIKRHLEENRFSEYFALYEVDIDTETLKVVIDSPYYSLGRMGTAYPYADGMKAFALTLEGDAKEFFLQLADMEHVRGELANEGRHTYAFRYGSLPGNRWVDCTSYVTYRHEDGTPAMYTLGFSFIDSQGAARQELQNKIAAQKTQLETQQAQLREALDMAQSANRAKTEFLFNMSHDVRTPMNAILGFTNMAEKHIDDKEKVMDCLEKTKQSGSLLLSLINGVLDMSRIEHGGVEKEENAGDVFLSFVSIEATLREEASKKDIDLSFAFGEVRDRFVFADFTRSLRIFTNLITNAIKYTKAGGYVKVFCEQASAPKDGYAVYRYTVEDNGIGMSKEFQKRMFESFTREHNTTVSGIQGTGLGLSVCKAFVEYLGGTIECESEPEKGTKFTVLLPFRVQEGHFYTDPLTGEIVAASSRREKEERKIDFTGKRVLLVEDNELNREIATELLSEEGFLVEEVEDGSCAVDMLKEKGPDRYDFILMDIQMPVMNGYDATRAIRAMYPEAHIPIIALSANAFAEDKKASLAAGMDDHVAKPINIKELFGALSRFL